MGLSLRAYARHRGVSEAAVRKAIKSGRITQEPDGTVDPEQADQQWERHTRTQAKPNAATEGSMTANDNDAYAKVRITNEMIKAQRQRLKLDEEKGTLIDRANVLDQVFRLARTERDAWINWPARVASQVAAEFNVDPQQMHLSLENHVREHLHELADIQLDIR